MALLRLGGIQDALSFSLKKKFFFFSFIFGSSGSSLLRVFFSSCGERGPLFVVVRCFSLRRLHLLRSTGSRASGLQ